jgi:hypothetical protein
LNQHQDQTMLETKGAHAPSSEKIDKKIFNLPLA